MSNNGKKPIICNCRTVASERLFASSLRAHNTMLYDYNFLDLYDRLKLITHTHTHPYTDRQTDVLYDIGAIKINCDI